MKNRVKLQIDVRLLRPLTSFADGGVILEGKRCSLIVNPTSGGYSRHKIDQVMAALENHGFRPELLMTATAADPPLFARRLCLEEPDPLLMVGGGDGTLNGVLNGLLPGQGTIALLPLGTANVMARELGITSAEEAVRRVVRGTTRMLPVGLIQGTGVEKYFFLMAGIGFDGAVVADVRLEEKKLIGKGAYLLAALRRLIEWDRQLVTLSTEAGEMACHSIVVCNGARYGGDFVLAPDADLFSPGFQVVCIRNRSRWTYVRLALALLAGRKPAGEGIATVALRELAISGSKALQADGDYVCHTPVRITTVNDFVRMIV
jgi:YegS/Rv2252/BmrU family lipid kinase